MKMKFFQSSVCLLMMIVFFSVSVVFVVAQKYLKFFFYFLCGISRIRDIIVKYLAFVIEEMTKKYVGFFRSTVCCFRNR